MNRWVIDLRTGNAPRVKRVDRIAEYIPARKAKIATVGAHLSGCALLQVRFGSLNHRFELFLMADLLAVPVAAIN